MITPEQKDRIRNMKQDDAIVVTFNVNGNDTIGTLALVSALLLTRHRYDWYRFDLVQHATNKLLQLSDLNNHFTLPSGEWSIFLNEDADRNIAMRGFLIEVFESPNIQIVRFE